MEETKGDARCPNCRRPYDQKNFDFKPLDANEIKAEKFKQKTKKKTHKSRKVLANVRVIQRNLVYVVGLTLNVAKEEFLGSKENFAKYGKISKLVVNKTNLHRAASQGREPTVSAYITYDRAEDATKAILAVDSTWIDGKMLRASFGTTKYCAYFLRGIQCTNPDCMYLHEFGHDDDTFTKDDIVLRNGLPTPVNGNLEPYTLLRENSNVPKHIWNYPRSNFPPTRNGFSNNETDSFWDTSETEGGDYEVYEGDYFDDEVQQEEEIYEEEEDDDDDEKPKVAIATANNTNSSESILPSTACWGNQNSSPSIQSNSASLAKSTFPTLSQVAKVKKQKKKKSKKSTQSKKSDQKSPASSTINEFEFDIESKELYEEIEEDYNQSKHTFENINDNLLDKTITSNISNSQSNSISSYPTKNIPRIDTSTPKLSSILTIGTEDKTQESNGSNLISSLKQLNEESTPLNATPLSSTSFTPQLEPNTTLSQEAPLSLGLFTRSMEKQSPSPTGPLLQQNAPVFTDFFQGYTQGHQTLSEQNNMGNMNRMNIPNINNNNMNNNLLGMEDRNQQGMPSLWSMQSEDHITQSRFAKFSEDEMLQVNQSRFANSYQQSHQDIQETFRSLLPNVKVNFSFGFDQQPQMQSHQQPQQQHTLHHSISQNGMWANNQNNMNMNIHGGYIQRSAQMQNFSGYGYPDYNQFGWGANFGTSNSYFQ